MAGVKVFAYDVCIDGIYYNLSEKECTATVTCGSSYYNSYSGNIVIPETISIDYWVDYRVTSIGNGAFQDCSGLVSVTIPESVTIIDNEAFWGCSSLTSVSIPESVTNIGDCAFRACTSLTSVTIPSSVESIGAGAFQYCRDLTSIKVDLGNSKYDSRNGCNAIIETESNMLIAGCINTVIPNTVKIIGIGAFSGFDNLTSVTIPEGVEIIYGNAFEGCCSLTSVTIPEGVTDIYGYAFKGCSSLTSVTIPSSVTSIGGGAFEECTGLTSVTVDISTPLSISSATFSNRVNAILYVPTGSKAAYEAADYWKEFKEIVDMPNQTVQFVDEAGNVMEDGSTITITEGEDDGWGGKLFPSGVYVQNTSDEDIYVGIDYDIKELPNGSFQIVFPISCMNISKEGTGKTAEGLLQAGEKKTLMAEWLPDIDGFGTCTVELQINTFTYNSISKKYELQAKGPTVTVRMVYSDDGSAPHPSTNNTLSASVPTLLIGKQATLSLNLTNEDELIAFEFDLQLPDGITIVKDEDNDPIATLSSRCGDHLLAVSDQGNGLYHFLCYSNSNKVISGNEGELLSIELLCDGNMAVGTYQATIKNIIFSDVDKNKITPADYTFDMEVIEAEPGDVNNDGEINVMDVVEMVAYIMGDGSEGFVFAAADLYPDGAINVMDLVNLVELIMNSSASNAREWTENSMSLSTLSDGAVSVKVNNPEQYVASEFIVEVSAGQTLETVTADKHHSVTCSQLDDSHYKVMTYSSANNTFNSDALVQLHISGEGMVNVHDALLVDESRKGVAFAPAVGGYTTGINQMENGKLIIENSSVYDLQGKKRGTSRPYKHEVLIVNGKKQVVR